MRAWGYENKLEEGRGGELARECWKEIREIAGRGKTKGGWEEERKDFMKRRGWRLEEVEVVRERGN